MLFGQLKRLGLRFLKKLYPQEQQQERVQKARAAFREKVSQIDPKQLVFLDETLVELGHDAELWAGSRRSDRAGSHPGSALVDFYPFGQLDSLGSAGGDDRRGNHGH